MIKVAMPDGMLYAFDPWAVIAMQETVVEPGDVVNNRKGMKVPSKWLVLTFITQQQAAIPDPNREMMDRIIDLKRFGAVYGGDDDGRRVE